MKKILCACLAALTLFGVSAQNTSEVYLVSNAHLDTQWNWDVQKTISKYLKTTIDRNLYLLDTYPDYIFNFEGGVKYSWIKEYYPREFELVKDYINSGRWHVAGASWEASDVIVPSSESFIRNILYGQQFYRDEFGVESTDIFLPDCFGFSWTLPTIAAHCGLIGFSSQKLGWRQKPMHPEGKRYPFNVGLWRGVDGAEVMMVHAYDYSRRWYDEDLSASGFLLNEFKESTTGDMCRYYGTGDIGGAPTTNSVRAVERGIHEGKGPLKIISAESDRLYKKYLPFSTHPELPVYEGELLMDVHGTGCYTSQAAMKFYNRQNECLGDAAERASVLADCLGAAEYPSAHLSESWKRFLWHQFHDDLTGTSIPRAYEFSWNDELLSLKRFSDILGDAVNAVSEDLDTHVKGIPVVLFNPLGFAQKGNVELSIALDKAPGQVYAYDDKGRRVRAALLGYAGGKASVLVEAEAPSMGMSVYELRFSGRGTDKAAARTVSRLENSVYAMTFDGNGDIDSIYDKLNKRQLLKEGRVLRLALFTDNKSYDKPAWRILKSTLDSEPESISDDVRITFVEENALRKTVLVEKKRDSSIFRQFISLNEGADAERIDFRNEIDWNLTNALLKAEFPLSVSSPTAYYDLGIGAVGRGNNTDTAYEVYSQGWTDLSDGDYGVTVMADAKYGWDKPDDNTIRLTLIHTPGIKSKYLYQETQDHGYHVISYSLKAHSGSLDRTVAVKEADHYNQPMFAFVAPRHKGSLGRSHSLARVDGDNMVLRAFKKAEDGEAYIVRIYETEGKEAKGSVLIATDIIDAVEADGTEKTIGAAVFDKRCLDISLPANGIRTYRVKLVTETYRKPSAKSVELKYDKACFSPNGFSDDGDFEGGYSYALELLPETLVDGGIPFTIEKGKVLNGFRCKGDTLTLPEGYGCLHILAAAALPEDRKAEGIVRIGDNLQTLSVPSYTGFVGQWGHNGQTVEYLYPERVAYVGTHRHSFEGDHAYEFTYMYRYDFDIPSGERTVVLPENEDIVIFAATVSNFGESVEPATPHFCPMMKGRGDRVYAPAEKNLLDDATIIGYSGYANERMRPENICDGDANTRWSDPAPLPDYIDFEFPELTEIHSWKILCIGEENMAHIISGCRLLGKVSPDDDWHALDGFTDNRRNSLKRTLWRPEKVKYLRLLVTEPSQIQDDFNTRILEFEVY